jgi:uracil-DNA glycosylase family protein
MLDCISHEERLAQAADAVAQCRKCAIGATRSNSVYGEGNPHALLMLVGEGPGETEDRLGRPFVGRAGELLDRMLGAVDLPRESVFIGNTVKCRPTQSEGGRLRNRAPDPAEMANCRPWLDEQIEIIRPRAILALGAPAARSFLGAKFSITRQRGQWFEGPLGIALIATFHPAYVLRQTGGELTAVKRLVWDDLKAVRAKLDEFDAHPAPEEPPPAPVQASLF